MRKIIQVVNGMTADVWPLDFHPLSRASRHRGNLVQRIKRKCLAAFKGAIHE